MPINTLRLRQNGRLFADDTFKCIFLNENTRISIKISLKFVLKGLTNNIPVLVLIMACCRPGDKPLSELMMVRSLTHICVTRPQWVKEINFNLYAMEWMWFLFPMDIHIRNLLSQERRQICSNPVGPPVPFLALLRITWHNIAYGFDTTWHEPWTQT